MLVPIVPIYNFGYILQIYVYIYFNIFRHVTHLSWNTSSKELELDKVDPHLKMFLDIVGVSEHQFRNQDTRDFIYDFIEKNGGMNAIREDISSSVPKTNVQQQLQQLQQQQQHQQQSPAAPQRQEYPPPVPARTITVCLFFSIIIHVYIR